ncbi:sialate O-acetylesterase [Flavobacterium sp. RHBU_3]|uniref:sialate O-acetylesterase n=1 Tax=Flavobacterium sp. RHBU_3 TaxID=3391184 RepID=UPI00398467F7
MKTLQTVMLALCLLFGLPASYAKVTLPSFFTSNMVLQQKSVVPFFGTSTAKEVIITSSWDKKTYTATTANGKWEVQLTTPVYGGPYTILIKDGKDKIELKNILIGEVWLCSGQSNMEMPVEGWGKVANYKEEIANAKYPDIRLLQAEHVFSEKPLDDLKLQFDGWQVCSPSTIGEFSSTAYFFARKVYQEKHIPIGLIHSSWGGTVAEAWTSAGALKEIHDFDQAIEAMEDPEVKNALQRKYDKDMADWNAQLTAKEGSMKDGKMIWAEAAFNDAAWPTMPVPAYYENTVLPDFDGIVWYRKTFNLPNGAPGDGVLELYVDDDEITWINGVQVGATRGYNTQRKYTIPASVFRKGENVIAIRSFDGAGGGGIYAPENIAIKFSNLSVPLSGQWKYKVGVNSADLPPQPSMPENQNRPAVLYNAMIHPIQKYKIAGVIWYQGEANASRAQQYQKVFPTLIKDWRKQFNNPALPFYFVQLANYKQIKDQPADAEWAELREAQFKTLALPYTGMAVITDIGAADNIHPTNKQDVGGRLALIALAKMYGVNVAFTGPIYKSFIKKGNTIVIDFVHREGIKAKDGELKGFAIAGADKKFYWADAKVVDGRVVVSSPEVKNPEAVRYNWADNPQGNLTNDSGLPATSFRTDNWPGITDGRK